MSDHSVKCSNYVGKTLEFAAELGFDAILFVAHLGKFVKVSGGIMNTHSHEADCRAELLTAQAVRAGADLALAKKTAGDRNDGRSGADFKGSRMPERDHGKSDRKNCFLHELPY